MRKNGAREAAAAGGSRWEAIAAELREDIVLGRLRAGERLPNELQLAQRFGVHRHTLRQAVQSLVQGGYLRVEHGRGTFARELVLDYALGRRTRLSENLAQAGEQARRELLAHEEAPAGDWAAALRLGRGARVEVLHTRASVRGRPVGISTAAYPLPRLRGMAEAFQRGRGVTAALQALGVTDYTRERSVVSARLPTPAEADALARAVTAPVLVVDYVNVDVQGLPVEAGRTLFAADAVQLTLGAEQWNQP